MKNTDYMQWYNENEGRAYPLSENSTRRSDSGVMLPDDIIVDMGLLVDPSQTSDWVPPGPSVTDHNTDIRLSSLRVTPQYITLGISSSTTGLLVGTYLTADIKPFAAYPLVGARDGITGWIVFGHHRIIVTEDYRFATPGQSRIEQRAIRNIDPIWVKGLVKAGGNAGKALTGIVKLQSGAGVKIYGEDVGGFYGKRIVVEMDDLTAQGLVSPCAQSATKEECKLTPIRSINGVCAVGGKLTLRFE